MPKHFFFDLDNTLTRSKSLIEPEHAGILRSLSDHADVIVVSGSHQDVIRKHLGQSLEGRYRILSQNGNYATDLNGTVLWERRLNDAQKNAVYQFIEEVKRYAQLSVKNERDLVEDRGCQISYSLIGHNEDVSKKEKFDPDFSKRLALLKHFHKEVERLDRDLSIEIKIGGTTCLDIFERGKNKGYGVAELVRLMDWKKEECMYVGDALFPGGNDETVIGVIPTKLVTDYHDTYEYLKRVLSS